MSWTSLNLSVPAYDAFDLNQKIEVISITPWTHGIKKGHGEHTFLSFPNTVEELIYKLATQPAEAVFAVAVYAANTYDLSTQIETITNVLPIKQLLQWQRHATKLTDLEKNKFNLVEQSVEINNMAINSIPEVKTRMEKAISQAALSSAAALTLEDPLTNLNAFSINKTAHDAEVNSALPALVGGAGLRFYSEGDVIADLRINHPGHEYTMTAILAFVGSPSDLAYLKEIMP